MTDMPATAEMYKNNCCRGDNSSCAKYMVFEALDRDKVPAGLFPNQTGRANAIIAGEQ